MHRGGVERLGDSLTDLVSIRPNAAAKQSADSVTEFEAYQGLSLAMDFRISANADAFSRPPRHKEPDHNMESVNQISAEHTL